MRADIHAQCASIKHFVVLRKKVLIAVLGEKMVKTYVSIEHQVPHAAAPVVPGSNTSESVVKCDSDITILEVAPAIHVELANSVHTDGGAHRFIEKLNSRDRRVASHVVADLVESSDGSADRVALAPASTSSFTRVIESVLRVRS